MFTPQAGTRFRSAVSPSRQSSKQLKSSEEEAGEKLGLARCAQSSASHPQSVKGSSSRDVHRSLKPRLFPHSSEPRPQRQLTEKLVPVLVICRAPNPGLSTFEPPLLRQPQSTSYLSIPPSSAQRWRAEVDDTMASQLARAAVRAPLRTQLRASPAAPLLLARLFSTSDSLTSSGSNAGSSLSSSGPLPTYFQKPRLPANTIVRFVPQQTAWIVERMGRFNRILEPGLAILMPFIDRIAYVKSLKEVAIEIPKQSAITADNVTLELDGVLYTRVFDAYKAR